MNSSTATPPKLLLAEMTREQIRQTARDTVVVLPTAATEQHGPHLPVITDTTICETVARRAAKIASAEAWVTVAPTVVFGNSHHHLPFAGVLSLRSETFTQVLKDLCDCLVRSGYQRILILNGHGGNDEAIRSVARDFGIDYQVLVGASSYWTVAHDAVVGEGRVSEVGSYPGHAGGFETSCIMALRPELVDSANMPQREGRAFGRRGDTGPLTIYGHRDMERINGHTDDPRLASAEAGERFLTLIAREVARTMVAFSRLPL